MNKHSLALAIVGTVAALTFALYFTKLSPKSSVSLFSSNHNEREIEVEFVKYIAKYGKSYSNKKEYPDRYQIFKQRYLMVKAHNNKKNVTSKLSINKFADMRPEEIGKSIELPDNYYQIKKANPLLLKS